MRTARCSRQQPIERLDILLLGDILDVIRSPPWLRSSIRPWNATRDPELIANVSEITDGILQKNKDSLLILKGLTRLRGQGQNDEEVISIRPSDGSGRPKPCSWDPGDQKC